LHVVRRRPSGAEVDLDAYLDARCVVAAGGDPGDGLYLELTRSQRDLGAVVLLDVSGSVAGADTDRRSTHREQQVTAAAIVEAFQSVGDRVAAYGFRSRGRHAVDLLRWKAFDERLSTSMLRLAGLEPSGFTRLGAAIRAGAHIAATEAGTAQRLLLVISDGIAFDNGYEGRRARSDSRHAILEARDMQVATACIAIRSSEDTAALDQVFGATAYVRAQGLDEVAEVLSPVLRRALAGVAG
jgi:nitric oxide reductase activation protein